MRTRREKERALTYFIAKYPFLSKDSGTMIALFSRKTVDSSDCQFLKVSNQCKSKLRRVKQWHALTLLQGRSEGEQRVEVQFLDVHQWRVATLHLDEVIVETHVVRIRLCGD